MLTAREMIEQLQKIDPETVPYWEEFDAEFAITYIYGIEAVSESGQIVADYRSDHPRDEELRGY